MQGAVATSLETLQMLAAGSTNLAKLKKFSNGGETSDSLSLTALSSQVCPNIFRVTF